MRKWRQNCVRGLYAQGWVLWVLWALAVPGERRRSPQAWTSVPGDVGAAG